MLTTKAHIMMKLHQLIPSQKYLWAACFAGANLYSVGYHRLQQFHIKTFVNVSYLCATEIC